MKEKIDWRISYFNELTTDELYAILHLRCKIFIMEQNAPYLDMDYKDQKALHLHGYIDGHLMAYSRLFKPEDYFDEASIGRVIIAKEYREFGYGHDLMDKVLETAASVLGETVFTISAQLYLQRFYESHGFVRTSEVYSEDGLPHIRMKKE